jgi:hypothetical protein
MTEIIVSECIESVLNALKTKKKCETSDATIIPGRFDIPLERMMPDDNPMGIQIGKK